LDLVLLPDDYAVCRLELGATLPEFAGTGVLSVTWTPNEISIICTADQAPTGGVVNTPWRCLWVNGPVNLALTGILASLVNPLAEARVNIFAFPPPDRDYARVRGVWRAEALAALAGPGHRVATPATP